MNNQHSNKQYDFSTCPFFCCKITGQVIAQEDLDNIVFGKYRILKSKILNQDRTLYVNLPQGYEDSEESYPVIFQLYGHFKENYYLPAVRTTTLLQSSGRAPGIIVVGVKNREFRYRDLLPVDHHQAKSEIDNFLDFFEGELIPFVENNYRVNGFRILAGPQAGAAFGVYSLAKRPDLFNAYFLSSPFWIPAAREPLVNLIREGLEHNEYSNKFVMITCRNNLGTIEMQYIDSLSTIIQNHGSFQYILNFIAPYSDFTSPIDMKKGLETVFNEYQFPSTDIPQDLIAIEKHFQNISKKYGFEIKIPELGLVFEGDKFVQIGQLEKAKEIFLKMEELYPKGLMSFDRLATIAFKQEDFELAIEYYEKFLQSEPDNPYAKSMIEKIKKSMN